jgi:hypothetical protein
MEVFGLSALVINPDLKAEIALILLLPLGISN